MKGTKIIKTIDKVGDLVAALNEFTSKEVLVGIPSETAGRKEGEIDNAALGFIHEHGAPEVNIPARAFLVPGIKTAEKQIIDLFKKTGQRALAGDKTAVMRGLNAVGMTAQNAVRQKITDGPFTPLKASTVRRRRKGRGKVEGEFVEARPLIDTGQLRQAITYVLRASRAPKVDLPQAKRDKTPRK